MLQFSNKARKPICSCCAASAGFDRNLLNRIFITKLFKPVNCWFSPSMIFWVLRQVLEWLTSWPPQWPYKCCWWNHFRLSAIHHDPVGAPGSMRHRRHRLQDPLVPLDRRQAPADLHDGWCLCFLKVKAKATKWGNCRQSEATSTVSLPF